MPGPFQAPRGLQQKLSIPAIADEVRAHRRRHRNSGRELRPLRHGREERAAPSAQVWWTPV